MYKVELMTGIVYSTHSKEKNAIVSLYKAIEQYPNSRATLFQYREDNCTLMYDFQWSEWITAK